MFLTNGAGANGHLHAPQKRNLYMDFTPFIKVNSKCNISLNVKIKSIKLLEDNRTENLDDLGYGDNFLNRTLKAQSMR